MSIDIPLLDETDGIIIAHKEAHFGGSFYAMIEYYSQGGIGASEECPLHRIEELYLIEKNSDENLTAILLPQHKIQEIENAKTLYYKLKTVNEEATNILAKEIGELILTEDAYPESTIQKIVAFGPDAIQPLFTLLDAEEMYSELSPGYGLAPLNAIRALSHIRSTAILQKAFLLIGRHGFEYDEALTSCCASQPEAEDFGLQRLSKTPSKDGEHASIILSKLQSEKGAEKALTILESLSPTDNATYYIYITYLLEFCPRALHERVMALKQRLHPRIASEIYVH